MTTLLLIRHGESEANHLGLFAGHSNPDLSERGLEQAKFTARFVADNFSVDKLYSSDLKRAYNTGKCIAELLGLEITADSNLREIMAGEWESKKFDVLNTVYQEEYRVWKTDIGNAKCTGGESVKELSERVFCAIKKIAEENPGKTVAITTHATPVRATLSIIETGGTEQMKNIPWVSNASVTVIKYDNGEFRVEAVSLDKHLDSLKTVLPSSV